MAEETPLPENSVANASDTNQEYKEKQKPKGTLENIISELGNFARKALIIGTVAATPLLYNFISPAQVPLAQVTTYAYAASKATTNIIQEKNPLEGVVRNGFNGALLSYPIAEGFKGLNSLETTVGNSYGTFAAKTAKAVGMAFGLQPAVVAGNTALNYGLRSKFREYAWKNIKRSFKLIALPGILNVTYLYQFGLFVQMSVSAALSFLLNYTQASGEGKGNIKNLYKELNPVSYISSAASATGKAARTLVYGMSESVYAIGSTLSKYISSGSISAASNPKTAAPNETAIPHHVPAPRVAPEGLHR